MSSGLRRNSSSPTVMIPLSLRFGLMLSFTIIIFLNESPILRSDADSCRSLASVGIWEGRLYVVALASLIGYEVDFILFSDRFAVFVGRSVLHNADVDLKSTYSQLIIDYVLHDVAFFLLAEIEHGIAYADIGEIIF